MLFNSDDIAAMKDERHAPVELIYYDLEIPAIFSFRLNDLREDLPPLLTPARAPATHKRGVHDAAEGRVE